MSDCFHALLWEVHLVHLQRCLNKLQDWADTNGFHFSTSNTVCIHFCRLRKIHLDPQLFLNGIPIPVVEKTKFLGLIFDRKRSFIPHLRYLKEKCLKAINLLRVVVHTSWGADQQTLLSQRNRASLRNHQLPASVPKSVRSFGTQSSSVLKLVASVWALGWPEYTAAYGLRTQWRLMVAARGSIKYWPETRGVWIRLIH